MFGHCVQLFTRKDLFKIMYKFDIHCTRVDGLHFKFMGRPDRANGFTFLKFGSIQNFSL